MAAVETQQPVRTDSVMEKKMEAMGLEETNNADSVEKSTHPSSSAPSIRDQSAGVMKTPFLEPVPSAKPSTAVALTPEQETLYGTLLEIVKGWKEIPSTKGKGGPIVDSEIMWLTRECLLRYLRATKWVVADASQRLLSTLSWRRDYDVDSLLDGEIVSPENETGKQLILGYDAFSRPCLYLNPGRQNTNPSPRQVQELVYMVERVIDMMVPGQDGLALLINFKQSKNRTNTAPGIGQGREVLNILQSHYPERLGKCYIINIPWVVWGFLKLITPFIDPLTREKLKFNEDTKLYVPAEQLWTENGGQLNFEYDHSVYWPALSKICAERRAALKERWEKAGKRYGESEVYLKGGDVSNDEATSIPLAPASDKTEVAAINPGEEKLSNETSTPPAKLESAETEKSPPYQA